MYNWTTTSSASIRVKMYKSIPYIRWCYELENIQNNVQNKNKVHSLKNVLYASNLVVSIV